MLHSVVQMLDASALYILAGFLLAGVLHVLLDRRKNLLDPLRGKGPRPVILGTLIGIPLPLCSCSVLPTAMSLLRSGASKGATASFLITVPETDVVSIMLTYGLLGPVMAVARPIASLFTGIVSGLAVDAATRDEKPAPAPLMMAEEETGGCCCSEPAAEKKPNPVREALQFGFVKFFDDIILILVLGLAISAVIAGVFPRVDTSLLTDNHFLSYALMLAVGIPMYICATASTPIAASLVLAGVSPGAALVLLLAGPATNTAGLVLMRRRDEPPDGRGLGPASGAYHAAGPGGGDRRSYPRRRRQTLGHMALRRIDADGRLSQDPQGQNQRRLIWNTGIWDIRA
jgi:uncharacterized protein